MADRATIDGVNATAAQPKPAGGGKPSQDIAIRKPFEVGGVLRNVYDIKVDKEAARTFGWKIYDNSKVIVAGSGLNFFDLLRLGSGGNYVEIPRSAFDISGGGRTLSFTVPEISKQFDGEVKLELRFINTRAPQNNRYLTEKLAYGGAETPDEKNAKSAQAKAEEEAEKIRHDSQVSRNTFGVLMEGAMAPAEAVIAGLKIGDSQGKSVKAPGSAIKPTDKTNPKTKGTSSIAGGVDVNDDAGGEIGPDAEVGEQEASSVAGAVKAGQIISQGGTVTEETGRDISSGRTVNEPIQIISSGNTARDSVQEASSGGTAQGSVQVSSTGTAGGSQRTEVSGTVASQQQAVAGASGTVTGTATQQVSSGSTVSGRVSTEQTVSGTAGGSQRTEVSGTVASQQQAVAGASGTVTGTATQQVSSGSTVSGRVSTEQAVSGTAGGGQSASGTVKTTEETQGEVKKSVDGAVSVSASQAVSGGRASAPASQGAAGASASLSANASAEIQANSEGIQPEGASLPSQDQPRKTGSPGEGSEEEEPESGESVQEPAGEETEQSPAIPQAATGQPQTPEPQQPPSAAASPKGFAPVVPKPNVNMPLGSGGTAGAGLAAQHALGQPGIDGAVPKSAQEVIDRLKAKEKLNIRGQLGTAPGLGQQHVPEPVSPEDQPEEGEPGALKAQTVGSSAAGAFKAEKRTPESPEPEKPPGPVIPEEGVKPGAISGAEAEPVQEPEDKESPEGKPEEEKEEGDGSDSEQSPENQGEKPPENKNEDETEEQSPVAAQVQSAVASKVTPEIIDSVTLEANVAFNALLNKGALWVWGLAIESIGLSVLLGAIVGDLLWALKGWLIRRVLSTVPLKGVPVEQVADKITINWKNKAHIIGMNAIILALIALFVLIVMIVGCNYPLSGKLSVIGMSTNGNVCSAFSISGLSITGH